MTNISPNLTTSAQSMLLQDYLHQLRLPTFVKSHARFAEDAAQTNQPYAQFLFAQAEQEIAQRERNRQSQRIKSARFPILKELADFEELLRIQGMTIDEEQEATEWQEWRDNRKINNQRKTKMDKRL